MPLSEVRATASFERRLRKYNRSRSHPIRPLPVFQRYRYSKQRWRFVYSIRDDVVTLDHCDVRRERTYRRQG